jgi:hypothetical protein
MRSFMPQKGYFPPQKGYFPLLNKNIFKLTNILCHTKHSKIYIYFFIKKNPLKKRGQNAVNT